MNIFEQGIRKKVRFQMAKGQATIEDLYDLSLESLNNLALSIDNDLIISNRKSFIQAPTPANTILNLKFKIVLAVIETKMAEKEQAELRAITKSQIEELDELLVAANKRDLANLSKEELLAKKRALLNS